ncbi:MAG: baseplate protein [Gammaproteobacteria bacterium CG_4_10_14_0_8_um_filter_38_16]|nr:MAG: baseplate protein [Gammaproteobacteria bacterium CG_4_10_14_0_8_um_filter_38_16]
MPIEFKSFQTLVNDQVTAVQGATATPIDFNVGTNELALVEANAGMGVFLEYLANSILALARAATSTGVDLDSWIAQFPMKPRLAGVKSSGNVQFSRFTASSSATIPVGSLVKSTDFTLSFEVIADDTNVYYNSSLKAYVIPALTTQIPVKVQCLTAGTIGNVSPNVITVIASPISGVDTINNLVAFTNGKNSETDAELRARFILYINSLSRAVLIAYANAISSIPEIIRYNVVENKTYAGAVQEGYVYTVIDDGTGSPPADLIDKAYAAIQTVRGLAIQNDVFGPDPQAVNIIIDLTILPVTTEAVITELVTDALSNYINNLAFNEVLPYSRIFEIVYDASPYIINATNLTLNGGTTDLSGTENRIFIADTITVGYL